jgi:REP element-mobilizing transposase RayT
MPTAKEIVKIRDGREGAVEHLVPTLCVGTHLWTLCVPKRTEDWPMTRSRYKIFETEYPHFLTCTVVGWLPIFTRQETVQILFDSWRYLQQHNRLQIYGYVILENHLHLIASSEELSKEIGDFKSYTARRIIDHLEERNVTMLLDQLRRHKARHKADRIFQVWQEGCHPQQVTNGDIMRQKLEYIHRNPVARGYVDEPTHWRYSSARNYAGLPGLLPVVTDWG